MGVAGNVWLVWPRIIFVSLLLLLFYAHNMFVYLFMCSFISAFVLFVLLYELVLG